MKRKFAIIILLSITSVILFESCATKRLLKQAAEFENAGLHAEAAESYYQVLRRDRTNIEAMTGLRRSGEFTLQRKLSAFNRAYNERKNQEAVSHYQDALSYFNRMKAVNVTLNFPSFYHDYYNEVKDVYLDDLYFEGMNLLQTDNFARAERTFRNILGLDPNYRDASEQLKIAVNEPKYRESLALMEGGNYRQAYFKLDEIIKDIGRYKDVHDLRRESLEKGTVSIAVAPIKNSSSTRNIERSLENEIITRIQNLENPFLKLIDYSQMQEVVRRRESTAVVGFTAPTATLFCEIVSFTYNAGRLSETKKTGWLRKRVRFTNSETGSTEFRNEYTKVQYSEFSMSRSVSMRISYRLINERTGQILNTGTRNFSASDNIHYADYDGDNDNLVPGYWKYRLVSSSEDVINDNARDVRALQGLLNARKSIKTYNSLLSEAYDESSAFVAAEIHSYVLGN